MTPVRSTLRAALVLLLTAVPARAVDGPQPESPAPSGYLGIALDLSTSPGATERYRVSGFPTLYLIDRQGIVRRVFIGGVAPDVLETAVDALLDVPVP